MRFYMKRLICVFQALLTVFQTRSSKLIPLSDKNLEVLDSVLQNRYNGDRTHCYPRSTHPLVAKKRKSTERENAKEETNDSNSRSPLRNRKRPSENSDSNKISVPKKRKLDKKENPSSSAHPIVANKRKSTERENPLEETNDSNSRYPLRNRKRSSENSAINKNSISKKRKLETKENPSSSSKLKTTPRGQF